MEILVMAKEQGRFSEGYEYPRGCGKTQKVKLSTDMAYFAIQIIKIGLSDLCWFKDLILMKYNYGSIEMDNGKNRKDILNCSSIFILL